MRCARPVSNERHPALMQALLALSQSPGFPWCRRPSRAVARLALTAASEAGVMTGWEPQSGALPRLRGNDGGCPEKPDHLKGGQLDVTRHLGSHQRIKTREMEIPSIPILGGMSWSIISLPTINCA